MTRWLDGSAEAAAGSLRAEFEAGKIAIVVPGLLAIELLNIASRQWHWNEDRLAYLVDQLEDTRFDVREPPLHRVAHWTALGLTAYDATYVALAEERGIPLITNDREILALAGGIAQPVTDG